ncbi:MAG: hypothetical protein Q4C95_00060 [Planctomycetia bacterium]|nr:hypothetical protein [Planctomycetia bacterium]
MKNRSQKSKMSHFISSKKILESFLLIGIVLFTFNGCALFGEKKSQKNNVDVEIAKDNKSQEEDLGEYVASYGRSDPKAKKKIDPGQTFLFSDKAKEIYANTER